MQSRAEPQRLKREPSRRRLRTPQATPGRAKRT